MPLNTIASAVKSMPMLNTLRKGSFSDLFTVVFSGTFAYSFRDVKQRNTTAEAAQSIIPHTMNAHLHVDTFMHSAHIM